MLLYFVDQIWRIRRHINSLCDNISSFFVLCFSLRLSRSLSLSRTFGIATKINSSLGYTVAYLSKTYATPTHTRSHGYTSAYFTPVSTRRICTNTSAHKSAYRTPKIKLHYTFNITDIPFLFLMNCYFFLPPCPPPHHVPP